MQHGSWQLSSRGWPHCNTSNLKLGIAEKYQNPCHSHKTKGHCSGQCTAGRGWKKKKKRNPPRTSATRCWNAFRQAVSALKTSLKVPLTAHRIITKNQSNTRVYLHKGRGVQIFEISNTNRILSLFDAYSIREIHIRKFPNTLPRPNIPESCEYSSN